MQRARAVSARLLWFLGFAVLASIAYYSMRAPVEPTTNDTPAAASRLHPSPDESLSFFAENSRLEADAAEPRLDASVAPLADQVSETRPAYREERLYLPDDEFYALQSTVIDRVIGFGTATESSLGDLPTVRDMGFTDAQLDYYKLEDQDRVMAINQQPIQTLLGDGMTGSLLAGREFEIELVRGDEVIAVTFGTY